MTNREFFKNFSEKDFVKWLASLELVENAPWLQWFDKEHCKKCQPIMGRMEGHDFDQPFAPCEFEVDECPYGVADLTDEELIEMWLDAEREEI